MYIHITINVSFTSKFFTFLHFTSWAQKDPTWPSRPRGSPRWAPRSRRAASRANKQLGKVMTL